MLEKINKINGKFEWYNSKERLLVCPLPSQYGNPKDIELTIWQLEKLGCRSFGIIDMPLPFPHQFLQVKLPPFLSLADEVDDDYLGFCFVDERKRQRLRVSNSMIMMHTNVWTKYLPQYERNVNGTYGFMPCVIDTEFEDEEGDEDQRKVIWSTSTQDVWGFDEMMEIAKKWLDENYPDWKNPSAYWT